MASTLYALAVPHEADRLVALHVTGMQIAISKVAEVIRYGKAETAQIVAAARLQLSHGKSTHFLFETRTMQTRLQKAIRQMMRKELAGSDTTEPEHKRCQGALGE